MSLGRQTKHAGRSMAIVEGIRNPLKGLDTYGHAQPDRHERSERPRSVPEGVSVIRPAAQTTRAAGRLYWPTDRPEVSRLTHPNATRRNHPRSSSQCASFRLVEGKGFEPSTSALRTPRSPN